MIKLKKDKSSIHRLCMDTIVGLKSTIESLHSVTEAENEEKSDVQPSEEAENTQEAQNQHEEIQVLEEELKEARKSFKLKQAILERENKYLEAIQECIGSIKSDVISFLKSEIHPGEKLLITLRNILRLFGESRFLNHW